MQPHTDPYKNHYNRIVFRYFCTHELCALCHNIYIRIYCAEPRERERELYVCSTTALFSCSKQTHALIHSHCSFGSTLLHLAIVVVVVVIIIVVDIVVAGLFKSHLKNLIVYFPFGYYSATINIVEKLTNIQILPPPHHPQQQKLQ